ncbi:hypothetical protein, partial [Ralstonia sp.]|uniref:hypothetical protein n=1 Tax=Ralstonia sp. TaxID=54061 RepID=UPI002C351CD2
AGAGACHRRDSFLCLHLHDLVFSALNMQKALRGDDSPAILILSININSPVATGRRQGFPEFGETSLADWRGRMGGAGHRRSEAERPRRRATHIH